MSKTRIKTLDLVYIALGAVLIAVCSWLSIPALVPFTMQTFAVFFCLSALGGKRGTGAIVLYMLLGAIGLPVFSHFGSGVGVLFGSTGGYILGFLFIGLIDWLLTSLLGKKLWVEILALVLGEVVLYIFGTAWYMVLYTRANGPIGLSVVLGWCVFPFLIPDLVKLVLALFLSRRLAPILKRS